MEVRAAFVLDGEDGISLQAMQGTWASSCSKREVSWFFMSCRGNLGYILEIG